MHYNMKYKNYVKCTRVNKSISCTYIPVMKQSLFSRMGRMVEFEDALENCYQNLTVVFNTDTTVWKMVTGVSEELRD
jgi:hypothetical protein